VCSICICKRGRPYPPHPASLCWWLVLSFPTSRARDSSAPWGPQRQAHPCLLVLCFHQHKNLLFGPIRIPLFPWWACLRIMCTCALRFQYSRFWPSSHCISGTVTNCREKVRSFQNCQICALFLSSLTWASEAGCVRVHERALDLCNDKQEEGSAAWIQFITCKWKPWNS
jgi:hypothetical protein